ncbi:hypothetical protein K0M31_017254 [Melipona bicolor]|uniref:Uncharacterized protein n=1 Tax=Melipona bicolor TaxID=60889 RepID=A0AA40KS97_9HYME|nr:hypothetical protein K0M31_017254 [Melipona bicolor]
MSNSNSLSSGNSGAKRVREQRSNRIDNFPPGECICGRSNGLIVCNACGFHETGRVRYPCPVHHQILFITDVMECQKCKADYNSLSEVEI